MDSQRYFNPYSGATLFDFLIRLMHRLWLFLSGQLSLSDLASDEIQILVLVGIAASSALVGSFLVLRKMTMLANSLSHTILIGIVLAFLWTNQGSTIGNHSEEPFNIHVMLLAALAMGIVTTFLTEILTRVARLQEDASTGIVFTTLFTIGIISVTLLTRSTHIGTDVVMGNVDALQRSDCKLVYIILFLNIFLIALFFKEFKITTFDPALAKAFGLSTVFFNYLLMVQVSFTTIGAFRAVGVLMVLAFISGPPLAARLFAQTLGKMLLLAVIVGMGASIFGVALSRHLLSVHGVSYSTAGIVVCTITLLYLVLATWANKDTLIRMIKRNRRQSTQPF